MMVITREPSDDGVVVDSPELMMKRQISMESSSSTHDVPNMMDTCDRYVTEAVYEDGVVPTVSPEFPDRTRRDSTSFSAPSTPTKHTATPSSPRNAFSVPTSPMSPTLTREDSAEINHALLNASLDSSMMHHSKAPQSLTGSEGVRRTAMTVDEMRSVLMEHKQRVIARLEALGYDPFKGLYVKHRAWLMSEKEKVVNRLEELGIDPVTGNKKQRVQIAERV